jgi:hypothetical protein
MKTLNLIILLSISVVCFSQKYSDEYYKETKKASKIDLSKVDTIITTDKHIYYFFDTTTWKIKEIISQGVAIASPFLFNRFILALTSPQFLIIECIIITATIIYTKIYIRNNRYIRIKKPK